MSYRVIVRQTKGARAGSEFIFDQHDTFLFGRATDCHVSLPDDGFVSRHHFLLEINPPIARVRDLGSLNGTMVDGHTLGGTNEGEVATVDRDSVQADLRDGSVIRVGETRFEVAVHNDTAAVDTKPLVSLDASTILDEVPALDGYVIERQLGQGATCSVYLAVRSSDSSKVALKIVKAAKSPGSDLRKLFLREVEALRVLNHPHIVSFADCGETPNALFLAMRYCEMGCVQSYIRKNKGKLSVEKAVSIMVQALEGLAYAHARGYVHRDLKPQNILLTRVDGRARALIADFGLAKCLDLAGLSGFTATGQFGGTLPFMPREQLTNYKYVATTSDVWSMGATLYYMLTRAYPREGKPDEDPLSVILNGRLVPISDRGDAIPSALSNAVMKALATEPADRFPDAKSFRSALIEAVRGNA